MADEIEISRPKRFNQVIGAIAACMGVLSLGTIIGWASPAEDILLKEDITDSQFTHICTIMCLGAASAQPYLFLTIDRIGRKWTMITLAIPIIIFWLLIGVINNWIVFLVARFFLGFCGGGYCMAVPNYIGEYSDKSIRGALGIMFQLLMMIGIMFSYTLGLFENRLTLCLPLTLPSIICITMAALIPESPLLLITKKDYERVEKALQFYRGKDFDVRQDIEDIEDCINYDEDTKVRVIKSCCIGATLLVSQVFTGIITILYCAESILRPAIAKGMSFLKCCLISGVGIIISIIIAAFLIEKVGRRILLLTSLGIMCISTIGICVYTFVSAYNEDFARNAEILPLFFLHVYIFGYAFGIGPVPWVIMGEIFPPGFKRICQPIILALYWILIYAIVMVYTPMEASLGEGPLYMAHAAFCVFIFVFVLYFLVETKGKTLYEIQIALSRRK